MHHTHKLYYICHHIGINPAFLYSSHATKYVLPSIVAKSFLQQEPAARENGPHHINISVYCRQSIVTSFVEDQTSPHEDVTHHDLPSFSHIGHNFLSIILFFKRYSMLHSILYNFTWDRGP